MKALHTCIRVKDLEASVNFYTQAFPFKETRRRDFPDKQFTLVYLALEGEDYELELTYNYDHEAYDLGNGYGHIAVGSDNFQEDHDMHVKAGYPVTDIKGLTATSAPYYFIQDPDGYKIEVIDISKK